MSLYIGNISESIPSEHLLHELRKFGEYEIWNFGKFAFIEYVDENSASKAVLSLNGRYMGGNILQIEYMENFAKPLDKSDRKLFQSISTKTKAIAESYTISADIVQDKHENPGINPDVLNLEPNDSGKSHQITEKNNYEMMDEDKTNTNLTKASNSEIVSDDKLGNDIGICEESKEIKEEKKERKIHRKKYSKGKGNETGHRDAGNDIETYGQCFKLKKINKHKDENSIVICELCQREFKKKSIRSHTSSLMHKSKIS